MLELIALPKRDEKKPRRLFFIGFLYASLAFLIVKLIFSKDVVLSESSGILIVMFSALFSIIFVFYALKTDEKENIKQESDEKAIEYDWKILKTLLYLFLGFVAAFTILQIIFPNQLTFNSQIKTYCVINKPFQYQNCLDINKINETLAGINPELSLSFSAVFLNNATVAIFVLIFSLIFGAGVIFIIAWNASILGTVIAFSAKYRFSNLPSGILKFLIHSIPEIIGYLAVAIAGGTASFALVSFLRKKLSKENTIKIIRRSLYLILIGIFMLFIAGLIEIYISPNF